MIEKLVDFALKNRFLVLGMVSMLLAWGGISFHNLPIDAYPDVADNYVNIITGQDIRQRTSKSRLPCHVKLRWPASPT